MQLEIGDGRRCPLQFEIGDGRRSSQGRLAPETKAGGRELRFGRRRGLRRQHRHRGGRDCLQGMHECPRGVETLRRVRGECRRQDPAHRRAFVREERRESAFLFRVAEPTSGQQFVRDGADRVHVGGSAPWAAVAALRRGVRASNGRLQTCLMQRQRNSDPGDADAGSIALKKHIARVQGAVADPRLPGRIDHLRQRPKKIDSAIERHWREVAQAELERLTGDIVGRKIGVAGFLSAGKNIDRAAMVDRASDYVSERSS